MAPPAALPAILIFAATYFVLALGRLPGFRVDRTGAAIIGATLMVAVNALTLPEAVAAINTDTILLLFGMMIVVANLRLSGIFALNTEWVVRHAHRPLHSPPSFRNARHVSTLPQTVMTLTRLATLATLSPRRGQTSAKEPSPRGEGGRRRRPGEGSVTSNVVEN